MLIDNPGNELAETIAKWQQECQDWDLVPLLAEQLEDDFATDYVDAWDEETSLLVATACEILLSRVDWQQVAERLMEHVAGTPEPILVRAVAPAEPNFR